MNATQQTSKGAAALDVAAVRADFPILAPLLSRV